MLIFFIFNLFITQGSKMIAPLLKVFGSSNERFIKKMHPTVDAISMPKKKNTNRLAKRTAQS